jgi:hypothetical protein
MRLSQNLRFCKEGGEAPSWTKMRVRVLKERLAMVLVRRRGRGMERRGEGMREDGDGRKGGKGEVSEERSCGWAQ